MTTKEYINMPEKEKIALMKRVVRAANKDQKDLIDKYDAMIENGEK